jgi:hypothetical protein
VLWVEDVALQHSSVSSAHLYIYTSLRAGWLL